MIIKPFGDQILVKPVAKPQVLVPDDVPLDEYGDVIAIGDHVKSIKVGDKVGFSVFGIEKLIIEDQKYYFIRESAEFLLCTIQDELS